MKKFLSYILLAVMCISLFTGCDVATTDDDTVSPDGTVTNRGIVRDTDGMIDGVDGDDGILDDDDRDTIHDGDGNGRTVYDGNGRVINRADGNTRNAVDNVTDNTKRANR